MDGCISLRTHCHMIGDWLLGVKVGKVDQKKHVSNPRCVFPSHSRCFSDVRSGGCKKQEVKEYIMNKHFGSNNLRDNKLWT